MRRAPMALDIALLLMQVAWLSVAGSLLAVLLGAEQNPVPLWLGATVASMGLLSSRLFSPETMPVVAARALTAGVGLSVIYVAVALLPGVGLDPGWPLRLMDGWQTARHMIVGGLLVLAFWWSGSRVGQSDAPAQTLGLFFRIGTVAIVLGALAHVVLPVHVGATAPVFLFFGAGIAGFALSHIISMSPDESAGLRDWPRIATLAVGGVLLGSILLAFAAEGDLGLVAAKAMRFAGAVLTPVAGLVAWAIGMMVEALTYAILSIVSLLRDSEEPVRFNLTSPNFSNVRPDEGGDSLVPGWILRGLGWVTVLLATAGLILLLWRSLIVRARARTPHVEEERERLEGEGTLKQDLAAALGSLLGRFAPRQKADASPLAGLDPRDPRSAALGAYYSLLAFGQARGVDRQPWQTPEELREDLARHYPAEEVAFLTEVFQRTRYAHAAPSGPEADRLRAAWTALQSRLAGEKG